MDDKGYKNSLLNEHLTMSQMVLVPTLQAEYGHLDEIVHLYHCGLLDGFSWLVHSYSSETYQYQGYSDNEIRKMYLQSIISSMSFEMFKDFTMTMLTMKDTEYMPLMGPRGALEREKYLNVMHNLKMMGEEFRSGYITALITRHKETTASFSETEDEPVTNQPRTATLDGGLIRYGFITTASLAFFGILVCGNPIVQLVLFALTTVTTIDLMVGKFCHKHEETIGKYTSSFFDSLKQFTSGESKFLNGLKITLIGAGGIALAVAFSYGYYELIGAVALCLTDSLYISPVIMPLLYTVLFAVALYKSGVFSTVDSVEITQNPEYFYDLSVSVNYFKKGVKAVDESTIPSHMYT